MEIGIDFDGVVIDCGDLKARAAEMLYRIKISPAIFRRKILVGRGVLSERQYREIQKLAYEGENIESIMKPVDGVFEYLSKLREEGNNIKIVTSRGEIGTEVAKRWMTGKGLNIPIIGVGYRNQKTQACQGLDIYVDDDLEKIMPLIDTVPNLFLFTWEYNRDVEGPASVKRVENWRELYQEIKKIETMVFR